MEMATTNAGEHSVTSPADASGDVVLLSVSGDSDEQQTESTAEMVKRKVKSLNKIASCIALLEWAGNAVGTLALLWATVVLLGGFSSMLINADFWFFTVMIFMEATRVFIRNDASVNQWLLGSTRAFKWDGFSFPRMHNDGNLIAVIIGAGISLTPVWFGPEIVAGILKVAFLAITSQLLTRRHWGLFVKAVLILFMLAAVCGGTYGFIKMIPHNKAPTSVEKLHNLKFAAIFYCWLLATLFLAKVTGQIMFHIQSLGKPVLLLCYQVFIASGLACLPFLQGKLGSVYRYLSISIAAALLTLDYPFKTWEMDVVSTTETLEQNRSSPKASEQSTTLLLGTLELLLKIVDRILPILFFWSVMFPLPGISLKVSFYMLFSVIAAVLVGNLQIPVAFLQVLLSVLRLRSLLGHHHHDYQPLPDGASPNLVPSIVVFYMMELCQGSSYVVATILGLVFLPCRRSLLRDLGFTQEWGAKAVNLYYHQAYQARTENGLFPSEQYTPSLTSFAIECLGGTSNEIQIFGLRILDNFLQHWDSKSKMELTTEITSTSKKAASTLIDMLGSTDKDIRLLAARIIDKLTHRLKVSEFPGMVNLVCLLFDANNRQDALRNLVLENYGANLERGLIILQRTLWSFLGMSILQGLACEADNRVEIAKAATHITTKIVGLLRYFADEENIDVKRMVYCSALKLSIGLASNGGKVGARFRQELSENPFLLNSLEHILGMEDCQQELQEPVMDIIAKLALDEAARQEIGSSQAIIGKLVCAFLRPDNDVNSSVNNASPLRRAAGEALANLTVMSTDNCWAILFVQVEPEHNLIENLINMLDNEYYICVAANLLHNLCSNSGDKLVELGHQHLESATPKVMEMIMTRKGKQLEAALCVASQIGYAIPKYYAQVLESADINSATALVGKLLYTLSSIREPCLEYPRIRRVLVEAVISIVDLCPRYINIFREKRAKDALDMVKGTPSRLEKYRVFLDGNGVVAEILPMRELVDKAKSLIY